MPTIPVPVFDDTHHYITYDDNPGTKIKTVAFDLTGSQWSDGGSAIVSYKTVIAWQPAGQTATVSGGGTSTPSIINIDASVPGTIVVLAVVEDDNATPTLKKSYDSIQPRQNGASPNFGRGAYSGVGPVPTQIAYISVETPTGLLKHGRFQREWLDLPGGYNTLVDRVDQLTSTVNGLSSDGRFDDLYEKTAAHGIYVHNRLDVQPTAEIRLRNSVSPFDYAFIRGNEDANTGLYMHGGLNKETYLLFSNSIIQEVSSVRLRNGRVEINGAQNIFVDGWTSLWTHGIRALGNDIPLYLRGNGTHDADVRVDVLQADTNNSYVHLKKRGSNSYDARIDDLLCNNINGIPYYAKPYFIYNKSDPHQTTGTVAELVLNRTVPAGALLVEGAGYVEITFNTLCANNNDNKEVTLEIDDGVNAVVTPISALFNTTGTYTTWTCRVAATGGAYWNVSTEIAPQGANVTAGGLSALQVLNWTLPWAVRVYIQSPDAAGDISYVCGSILVAPGVVPTP